MGEERTGSNRALRTLRGLLVTLVVLALAAAVLYLLSERNSRSFSLELRGGELRVMRGRFFPVGVVPYEPDDRVLARAYAPLATANEPIAADQLAESFADRDLLDRELFKLIAQMVEARVDAEDPERLAEAVALLARASLLGGITEEQRHRLRGLQAQVAFFEGRTKLDEAAGALRAAVDRLKLASDSMNKYSADAGELYERVAGIAEQLARAIRQPLASQAPKPSSAPAAEAAQAAPAQDTGASEGRQAAPQIEAPLPEASPPPSAAVPPQVESGAAQKPADP